MSDATNDLESLGFNTVEAALAGLNAKPLDPADPWDADVLAEARLLATWAGVKATFAHTTRGTAAYPCGLVGINRGQLEGLFKGFTGEHYKTAIFFALAHEVGHLSQFRHFGASWTLQDCPRIEIEAHADVLSGVWLGARLMRGQPREPEAIMEAGLRLKGGTLSYPTAYQRGILVTTGQGQAVMLGMVEPGIRDPDYTSFADRLSKTDVQDLLSSARRWLRETPQKKP